MLCSQSFGSLKLPTPPSTSQYTQTHTGTHGQIFTRHEYFINGIYWVLSIVWLEYFIVVVGLGCQSRKSLTVVLRLKVGLLPLAQNHYTVSICEARMCLGANISSGNMRKVSVFLINLSVNWNNNNNIGCSG